MVPELSPLQNILSRTIPMGGRGPGVNSPANGGDLVVTTKSTPAI